MADPVVPAVVPPVAPKEPVAPPAADEKLEFTKEAFNKRLEQAQRSAEMKALKALGFDSLEAATAFKTAAEATSKAAQEAERAKLDEMGKLRADLDALNKAVLAEQQKAKEAATRAELAEGAARLSRLFAEHGIKGTGADYAEWRLSRASADAKAKGETFDEADFIAKLVKDPTEQSRLGVAAPAPVVTPASTTNPQTGPNPKPPAPVVATHASQETPEQWAAWKRSMGIA